MFVREVKHHTHPAETAREVRARQDSTGTQPARDPTLAKGSRTTVSVNVIWHLIEKNASFFANQPLTVNLGHLIQITESTSKGEGALITLSPFSLSEDSLKTAIANNGHMRTHLKTTWQTILQEGFPCHTRVSMQVYTMKSIRCDYLTVE